MFVVTSQVKARFATARIKNFSALRIEQIMTGDVTLQGAFNCWFLKYANPLISEAAQPTKQRIFTSNVLCGNSSPWLWLQGSSNPSSSNEFSWCKRNVTKDAQLINFVNLLLTGNFKNLVLPHIVTPQKPKPVLVAQGCKWCRCTATLMDVHTLGLL